MLNFIGRPDFIAYDHRYADCPGFLIDRMVFGTPTFAWTVKDEHVYKGTRKKFDAAIFEHFRPKEGFQKNHLHLSGGKMQVQTVAVQNEKNRLGSDELFLKK